MRVGGGRGRRDVVVICVVLWERIWGAMADLTITSVSVRKCLPHMSSHAPAPPPPHRLPTQSALSPFHWACAHVLLCAHHCALCAAAVSVLTSVRMRCCACHYALCPGADHQALCAAVCLPYCALWRSACAGHLALALWHLTPRKLGDDVLLYCDLCGAPCPDHLALALVHLLLVHLPPCRLGGDV